MLKALLGAAKKAALPNDLSYEDARGVLETSDKSAQKALAARTDAHPEMLYFLAQSKRRDIRALVAANPATPVQADALLCGDSDDDVRVELARKIGRLVPHLDASEQARTRDRVIAVLEQLAADQLPRVRQIIAEEIKHADTIPREIVRRLAEDPELAVAAPILEYSPLLSDDDLLEIIAAGTVEGALTAIARRPQVSETVSDAVVARLEVPAVAALLANENAQIREDTLDQIVNMAEQTASLHEPLVMRQDLSVRAVRRVAGFVAASLLDALQDRHHLDEDCLDIVRRRVRARVAEMDTPAGEEEETLAAQVQAALDRGELGDRFVTDAAEAGVRRLVTLALVALTGFPEARITQVLSSQSGKAITALCWKAGLSMRTAMAIQQKAVRLPSERLQHARNGVDYAMSADEMGWQLSCFGLDT